ncbi:hypothetical protein TSUD_174260 [Trifolium subterraneum]|nr:hypothetical protein TSUD_174260 [Trifolium subterraneum]
MPPSDERSARCSGLTNGGKEGSTRDCEFGANIIGFSAPVDSLWDSLLCVASYEGFGIIVIGPMGEGNIVEKLE